jgi:hypothetical protein
MQLCNFVLVSHQFNYFIREQVFHFVTVDFQSRYLNFYFIVDIAAQSLDLMQNEYCSAGQYTTHLMHFHLGIKEAFTVGSLHSVSFARASLPVSKNAHVLAIDRRLDKGSHFVKYNVLSCIWRKNSVEMES